MAERRSVSPMVDGSIPSPIAEIARQFEALSGTTIRAAKSVDDFRMMLDRTREHIGRCLGLERRYFLPSRLGPADVGWSYNELWRFAMMRPRTYRFLRLEVHLPAKQARSLNRAASYRSRLLRMGR